MTQSCNWLQKPFLSASRARHAQAAWPAGLPIGEPPSEPATQVVPRHLFHPRELRPAAAAAIQQTGRHRHNRSQRPANLEIHRIREGPLAGRQRGQQHHGRRPVAEDLRGGRGGGGRRGRVVHIGHLRHLTPGQAQIGIGCGAHPEHAVPRRQRGSRGEVAGQRRSRERKHSSDRSPRPARLARQAAWE